MGQLTTHVLDIANGQPAAGMTVLLFRIGQERRFIGEFITNADGRIDSPLLDASQFKPGSYELVFSVGDYFPPNDDDDLPPFLDDVVIRFNIVHDEKYHVPLLVSPWSYSTYRGS